MKNLRPRNYNYPKVTIEDRVAKLEKDRDHMKVEIGLLTVGLIAALILIAIIVS